MNCRAGLAQAALLAILAFGAALALVTAASGTAPGPARAADDRIDPRVFEQIAAKGETTFWVLLRQRADLSRAHGIHDWGARGRFVYERLTRTADASQSGLRSLLRKQGVPFEPFWIVNTIRVTAGESVVKELAAQREVERIIADGVYRIQKPQRGSSQQRLASIEWGIDRIRASLVWSTFGVRGENVVVANIDTGVQYNHPALVGKYRGNQGGGSFDHNYNWYDPSRICGNPSLVPCDNNSHGTHTMGTMVGDDGAGNQIGVAPGARWIAAKGCESNSCSSTALLSSGQWVLAPTNLNGQNPRTDLRPNIVNNSWGGGGGDPFYQDTVNAWVASGIFPAFSNGNSGPGCSTSGSPGDFVPSYSAGAFDSGNNIASFSSRGPSAFSSEIKPNVAAPGVSVRSSVPTNSYSSFSGTSMASPHVAGTVALIWSAAPSLLGQIAPTVQLLDDTAIDTANVTCGGTTDDNNVWGEGRLDAFAAVDQSPRGSAGTLVGTVTAAGGGAIDGAKVDVTGPITRTTYTDANGNYSLLLSVGTYSVTASAFGRVTQTASGVGVGQNQTTTQNFALAAAPSHPVSGTVTELGGAPIANATVTILGTPLASATTDETTGSYLFSSVPEGTYDVQAEAGRCVTPQTTLLTVNGSETFDFSLAKRTDTFGYSCSLPTSGFISAENVLSLSGDDKALAVGLPFSFSFYGTSYSTAYVSTNGLISFTGSNTSWTNGSIPSTGSPNGAVYGFWDDLFVDSAASILTKTLGSAPKRQFVIEWRNVHFYGDSSRRIRFEILLNEDGSILTQYADIASDGREQGNSSTVGIENDIGTDALQYSYGEAAIADGLAVLYSTATGGGGSPTITTASLEDGTTGISYNESLTATGGTLPHTWDLAPGSAPLPPGLSLGSDGLISGTPTDTASYAFTVRVTDDASPSQSATKALSISVGTPVAITTTSLPGGTAGAGYSQTVAATGGSTPYGWSIVSGSLPPGLALNAGTGTISGTPTTAGSYGFTVQVTDSAAPARADTQSLEIVIAPGLSIITTSPLSPCKVGTSCSSPIEAVGGTSPYTWALVGGSLPQGFTWATPTPEPRTMISGVPTKPGNFSFTFQVTSDGLTATKTFSLKVNRK